MLPSPNQQSCRTAVEGSGMSRHATSAILVPRRGTSDRQDETVSGCTSPPTRNEAVISERHARAEAHAAKLRADGVGPLQAHATALRAAVGRAHHFARSAARSVACLCVHRHPTVVTSLDVLPGAGAAVGSIWHPRTPLDVGTADDPHRHTLAVAPPFDVRSPATLCFPDRARASGGQAARRLARGRGGR